MEWAWLLFIIYFIHFYSKYRSAKGTSFGLFSFSGVEDMYNKPFRRQNHAHFKKIVRTMINGKKKTKIYVLKRSWILSKIFVVFGLFNLIFVQIKKFVGHCIENMKKRVKINWLSCDSFSQGKNQVHSHNKNTAHSAFDMQILS